MAPSGFAEHHLLTFRILRRIPLTSH